jgi:hypothetical protein
MWVFTVRLESSEVKLSKLVANGFYLACFCLLFSDYGHILARCFYLVFQFPSVKKIEHDVKSPMNANGMFNILHRIILHDRQLFRLKHFISKKPSHSGLIPQPGKTFTSMTFRLSGAYAGEPVALNSVHKVYRIESSRYFQSLKSRTVENLYYENSKRFIFRFHADIRRICGGSRK